MAWADDVENAHASFLSTWGVDAVWTPLGGAAVSIQGVIKNPSIEEELRAGSDDGTSVVRFWVDSNALAAVPEMGDTVAIAGVSYTVGVVEVDIEGGAVLKLRKN